MEKVVTRELFQKAENEGWIKSQKHPEFDLYIYNYTPNAQYERMWDEVTLAARGLIVDANFNIIARPFPKFFNWEELQPEQIPIMDFEVYEKMDGSLGILYWYEGKPFIATRGSFSSDQAGKANELLFGKYKDVLEKLNPDCTYLFEIIYPENRIVLDYGEREELVLLAIIETKTGKEYPLKNIGFPVVTQYKGIRDLQKIRELNDDNKEGFVIRFANNFRMKIKFQEYIRLHRILTQVSSVTIWEYLKEGLSFEELLDKVPDEFYTWVRRTCSGLIKQYKEIEQQSRKEFKILENRKETALYFLTTKYPQVLFAMLDQRDYSSIIWKMVRPEFEKPFTEKI